MMRLVLIILAVLPSVARAQHDPDDLRRFALELRKLLINWGNPAQPPLPYTPAPDAEDAGARYLWLWHHMDQELAQLAGYAVWEDGEMSVYENDEGVTAQDVRAKLIEQQPWIEQLLAATRLEHCNFHVLPDDRVWPFDPSDPRDRVLLTGPRKATRILAADAGRLATVGEPAAAAERCAAIIRMAAHQVQHPRPLFHHISASSLLRTGASCASQLLQQNQSNLPQVARQALVEAAAKFPHQDPMGMQAAWNRSRSEAADFVRSQLARDTIGWRLMQQIASLRAMREMFSGMFERIAGGGEILPGASDRWSIARSVFGEVADLTPQQCLAALELAEALGDSLDAAWDAPDAEQRFRASDEAVEADSTGVFMCVIGLPRVVWRDAKECETELSNLRSELKRSFP
jgi:hypothetical protein